MITPFPSSVMVVVISGGGKPGLIPRLDTLCPVCLYPIYSRFDYLTIGVPIINSIIPCWAWPWLPSLPLLSYLL